jgi:NAD(P)-dependent dehydrogenase (short-subunit alcohol dehydrogenase family)
MNAPRIEGAVALVTGANRGIGRALTEALLSRGVRKIYATARDPEALRDLRDERLVAHAMTDEPLEPEPERARQHGERRDGHLAGALAARLRTRPREERHDAARRADRIPVIQVIGLGIVEVDRALHETQPEHSGEEVEVALRIARDRADVVDAEDVRHALSCRDRAVPGR